MPFFNPCRHRFLGFYCTYADSRCDEDDDCPDNGGAGYCAPGSDGMTSCQVFIPPP
jgi:hypothetical protein